MKAVASCFSGTEDICSEEIFSIVGKKNHFLEGAVLLDLKDEEILNVIYRSQIPNRIFTLEKQFDFLEGDDLFEKITSFNPLSKNDETFSVEVLYTDDSIKVKGFSQKLREDFKNKFPNNFLYKNHDKTLIVLIGKGVCYLGYDLCFDLSKRSYKLSTYGRDVKGNIAAAIVRFSGFIGKGKILDAFCLNGTVAIEAAFLANHKSPWYFDKDRFSFNTDRYDVDENSNKIYASCSQRRHKEATLSNATVAGVDENVECFVEESELIGSNVSNLDFVVANLPVATERNIVGTKRLYKEFLDSIKKYSSKNVKVVVFNSNLLVFKEELGDSLKILEERKIIHGGSSLDVLKFEF